MEKQIRPSKTEIQEAIAALRRRRKMMMAGAGATFCVMVGAVLITIQAFRINAAPPAPAPAPIVVGSGGKITFLKSQGKNADEGDILMLLEDAEGKIEIRRGVLTANGDAVTITVPDGAVSVNKEEINTPAP